MLTALDRKNAGLSLTGRPKKKAKKRAITKAKRTKYKRIKSSPAAEIFEKPFIEPKNASVKAVSAKSIGEITHYYEKIQVGVIKLTGKLEVGDMITYSTYDGSYEQIVESMEIDRKPVFKAGKGKEIGLKLYKAPRVGGVVFINK